MSTVFVATKDANVKSQLDNFNFPLYWLELPADDIPEGVRSYCIYYNTGIIDGSEQYSTRRIFTHYVSIFAVPSSKDKNTSEIVNSEVPIKSFYGVTKDDKTKILATYEQRAASIDWTCMPYLSSKYWGGVMESERANNPSIMPAKDMLVDYYLALAEYVNVKFYKYIPCIRDQSSEGTKSLCYSKNCMLIVDEGEALPVIKKSPDIRADFGGATMVEKLTIPCIVSAINDLPQIAKDKDGNAAVGESDVCYLPILTKHNLYVPKPSTTSVEQIINLSLTAGINDKMVACLDEQLGNKAMLTIPNAVFKWMIVLGYCESAVGLNSLPSSFQGLNPLALRAVLKYADIQHNIQQRTTKKGVEYRVTTNLSLPEVCHIFNKVASTEKLPNYVEDEAKYYIKLTIDRESVLKQNWSPELKEALSEGLDLINGMAAGAEMAGENSLFCTDVSKSMENDDGVTSILFNVIPLSMKYGLTYVEKYIEELFTLAGDINNTPAIRAVYVLARMVSLYKSRTSQDTRYDLETGYLTKSFSYIAGLITEILSKTMQASSVTFKKSEHIEQK